ncbi:MAG: hypothetical protein ACM358_11865 [Gemmatimonadota bacterium]
MPTAMLDTLGVTHDVPDEHVEARAAQGWKLQTHTDALAAATAAANEASYGGVAGGIKAGLAAAARGATLGLSDVAARALGGDNAAIALEGLREENPGISFAGEVGGALAPALLSGGAALPAGLAARAGSAVTALGEGGGALRAIGAAAAGGALEGAIFGAGQGVSELALSQDPLTVEHAASALSSNMLYGGLIGGALGTAGKALELGMTRAKGAIDGALARKVISETDPDIGVMVDRGDKRGLTEAFKAETDALQAARQPEREAFVQALSEHNDTTQVEQLWNYTSKHPNRVVRGLGAESREADIKIRNLLKNEEGLARNPAIARDALERQAQALRKIESEGLSEYAQFQRDFLRAPETIRQEVLDGKVKGYVVGKGGLSASSPMIDKAVEEEMVRRFGTANLNDPPVLPKRLQAIMDSGGIARRRVGDLLETVDKLSTPPTSPQLTRIQEALDLLGQPKEASLGAVIMSAAAPALGPMGRVAAAGGRVIGKFREVAAAAGRRTGAAASSFLGAASKGAAKAAPYTPIVATKILAGLKYAPGETVEHEGGTTLAKLFKARTDEIKSQTAFDEAGIPRMRPEARAAVAERLKPVRAVDPILADRLESQAARRLEYLSSLIPRRPDIMAHRFGPDLWQPSDMIMRSFARSAAAVEDPDSVLERATHGAVSPEDAQAMRAVWPEKLQDFISQVGMQLPALQKALPYKRRISLSILTGQPVDPAMDPTVMRVFQSQFQYEPEPPVAQPQFGSVKAREMEPATASQRREQGVTT